LKNWQLCFRKVLNSAETRNVRLKAVAAHAKTHVARLGRMAEAAIEATAGTTIKMSLN
jgi:hypothetical protein